MGTSMELIQNAYQGFAKQNYTMLDNLKLGRQKKYAFSGITPLLSINLVKTVKLFPSNVEENTVLSLVIKESVTAIPKGSTLKRAEAQGSAKADEEIA